MESSPARPSCPYARKDGPGSRKIRTESDVMTGELPRRKPGDSGYQRWLDGDLAKTVRVVMPTPAVPLADPEDPKLWERVEEALRGYGIKINREGR